MKEKDVRIELKRKKRKKVNLVMVFAFIASLVICVACVINIDNISNKIREQESQKAELSRKIDMEQLRTAEIANLEERINSKEYIEEVARNKFNLTYPDDIVFIPNE